jgi:hypothetical protein
VVSDHWRKETGFDHGINERFKDRKTWSKRFGLPGVLAARENPGAVVFGGQNHLMRAKIDLSSNQIDVFCPNDSF